MNTFKRVVFLLLSFYSLSAVQSKGQTYQTLFRPPGIQYSVVESDHFTIIYQNGIYERAREAAFHLEGSLSVVKELIGTDRPLKMPIVLNQFNDLSNGYVAVMPFKQEIEGVSIKGHQLPPRTPSWYATVLNHELVHAVHANSGKGFGVGSVIRFFAPDAGRAINFGVPAGISEGVAVYAESNQHEGGGRLNYALYNMQFRAVLTSKRPWSLAQMLEPPAYSRPFDRHYIGGGHFYQYLAESEQLRFFPRARDFFYRMPFLGYGIAMWRGTGTPPYRIGRQIRTQLRKREEDRLEALGQVTQTHEVASDRGLVIRRPRWLDNNTILVYQSGYSRRPGFYTFDINTGTQTLVSHQRITEDYYYSLDQESQSLYFARYVRDPSVSVKAIAEIFELDLRTGSVRALTNEARAIAPVRSPNGEIWILVNRGQFNQWSLLSEEHKVIPMTPDSRTLFKNIAPAPDGDDIAVLLNINGYQGIFHANVENGKIPTLSPWLLFETASIYDMTWSGDGRFLFFTADLDGVTNVYTLDRRQDRILKLTNVPFGALEPSLSLDGETIAFVNYRHECYELVTIPFDPEKADVIPRSSAEYGTAIPWEQWLSSSWSKEVKLSEPRPYRSYRYFKPRLLYPLMYFDNEPKGEEDVSLGLGLGLGIEGTDPLERWVYRGAIFRQMERTWGRFFFESARFILRPSVQIQFIPSAVTIQTSDSDGQTLGVARVGLEERSMALGLRTPISLSSNVFRSWTFLSLYSEFRQERFFDYEGSYLTDFTNRVSLKPTIQAAFRVQSNIRDIVPNSGVIFSASSRADVWVDANSERHRWTNLRVDLFLPYFRRWNAGIRIHGGLHAQNRGGIVNLDFFLPRGYETDLVYLGRGVYLNSGLEYVQPLWYIDNGFILVPMYFKAIYVFGFAETLIPFENNSDSGQLSSVGSGVGLQLRFAHVLDLDFKFGLSYLIEKGRWKSIFR